jgi:transposase
VQGKKEYSEKLFINFQLSERVPINNFYRRLKDRLNLSYLRKMTANYYGTEGQKSIDTVVFFKLMLIGYLENINSDRKIIENAQMRLDMLYFLGYDLDEPLPWHSTLSRTRQLFGEEVFLELFRNILKMCVEEGMVSGKIQAIDSAFIKANASMDSLVERELNEKSQHFFYQLTENEDGKLSAKRRLSGTKHNDIFVSTSDPDARVSQKPGKVPALNHLGIISVDTENHVICGATADLADKGDSETMKKIASQTINNLKGNNLYIEEILADTGYSSGASYNFLEKQNITAYIPPHGSYQAEKEGFTYDKDEDCYICSQGKKLIFKGISESKGGKTATRLYRTTTDNCRNCPLKEQCCKKKTYKNLSHSIDKAHYDKAYKLLAGKEGKRKIKLRSATVEPVWGTLLHFRGLKKVYTKGNDLASKQVLVAAAAYNLKKLLNLKTIKSTENALKITVSNLKTSVFNKITIFFEFVLFASNYKKAENNLLIG